MNLPLYRLTPPGFDPAKSHAGLWYDKFCDQWMGQWSAPEVKKSDWIRTVANGHPVGDEAVLKDFVRRQQKLVEATNGKCLALQTESRFVTGLGREHPVENGFAWHPTLGTPYLPASSIKGLLRAWANQWWANETEGEEREKRKALIDTILGRGGARGDDGAIGAIVIFDALPIQPVRLEADVMTPHYDDYYQKGLAPGDWINPVPIPFLAVAQGTQFQFAYASRTSAGREHLSTVEAWLKDALRWLGAGAKTAVGYGRFGVHIASPVTVAAEKQIVAKGPRYAKGDIVTVTRIDDPKPKRGKSRLWFIADDGFGGVVTRGTPPEVAMNESVQLQVAAVLQHGGYNFAVPKQS